MVGIFVVEHRQDQERHWHLVFPNRAASKAESNGLLLSFDSYERISRTNQKCLGSTGIKLWNGCIVCIWRYIIWKQRSGLDRGVEILVACPGRLLDLMEKRALTLEDVEIVVLDEADRMADMGFMEPVCDIIESCGKNPK